MKNRSLERRMMSDIDSYVESIPGAVEEIFIHADSYKVLRGNLQRTLLPGSQLPEGYVVHKGKRVYST
jgi:hypothetical protein